LDDLDLMCNLRVHYTLRTCVAEKELQRVYRIVKQATERPLDLDDAANLE